MSRRRVKSSTGAVSKANVPVEIDATRLFLRRFEPLTCGSEGRRLRRTRSNSSQLIALIMVGPDWKEMCRQTPHRLISLSSRQLNKFFANSKLLFSILLRPFVPGIYAQTQLTMCDRHDHCIANGQTMNRDY